MTGLAANFLNVKPMIHFAGGEIFSAGWPAAARRAWKRPSNSCWATWPSARPTPTTTASSPGTAYDADEGRRFWMQLRAALRARYPASECDAGLLQIGATIAVHTGPYALGVGVMRKWKKKA